MRCPAEPTSVKPAIFAGSRRMLPAARPITCTVRMSSRTSVSGSPLSRNCSCNATELEVNPTACKRSWLSVKCKAGIQADEAGDSDYKLVLVYRDMPANQREVEADTKAVLKAALDVLVKQGRNPAQEHLFVTVHARRPEKGATGQAVVRVFGRSVYDYNNDSITYKPQE